MNKIAANPLMITTQRTIVSPDNPDVILATTEKGLLRSTDGGRSFTSMPGPRLLLLGWPTDLLLVGITLDGAIQVSTDRGVSWQPRGNIGGAPEAFHAAGSGEIYAAVDGRGRRVPRR